MREDGDHGLPEDAEMKSRAVPPLMGRLAAGKPIHGHRREEELADERYVRFVADQLKRVAAMVSRRLAPDS